MSISERYRELVAEVKDVIAGFAEAAVEDESREIREIRKAAEGLAELQESVGEIPRIRLEVELTPVLLKAHSQFDRARLLFEEQGREDLAAALWELEQKIYRLLNDL
ncbi:hypothetical protein [Trichloromonas sp.]|uniref:hypothetical protein n=1 Tax=Trichloromonas sp. TaxID=3069249 RepID=UPI003D8159EC